MEWTTLCQAIACRACACKCSEGKWRRSPDAQQPERRDAGQQRECADEDGGPEQQLKWRAELAHFHSLTHPQKRRNQNAETLKEERENAPIEDIRMDSGVTVECENVSRLRQSEGVGAQ
jgi:hypothetical protein